MKKNYKTIIAVALYAAFIGFIIKHPINEVSAKNYDDDKTSSFNPDSCFVIAEVQTIEKDTMMCLAEAFAYAESRHNPKAYNKSGATGYLQIKKIMVDEANRIKNKKEKTKNVNYWSYEDRWDKDKSIEIFRCVMEYHNPNLSIRKACKIWNYKYNTTYLAQIQEHFQQNLLAD